MKKLLVVDDEPDILKVVQFRLMRAGYEVAIAMNGNEALEMIKAQEFDLILLDYSMPIKNGDELCKQLKADIRTRGIPIILMTASAKRVEDEHIQDIGANDKILKPFKPEDLLEKIKRLIPS